MYVETDRSIHDALMIVKRLFYSRSVVAGGGAIEMEVSRVLREHARGIEGKQVEDSAPSNYTQGSHSCAP